MNTNFATTSRITRRTLLKSSATTAGALGLLGGAGSGNALAAHLDSPTDGKLSTANAALAATQLQKLTASDASVGTRFGNSVSISADGTTALIGSSHDNHESGSAYVYDLTESPPTETKLTAADPERYDRPGYAEGSTEPDPGLGYDHFGYAVSISGDGGTAIVGTPGDNDLGYGGGSASVFDLTTTPPTETELRGSHDTVGNLFGEAVSMSADGTTAIVGAAKHEQDDILSGAAHVYDLTRTPPFETILLPSDRADWLGFGFSVSLDANGTTALIGATGDDDAGVRSGAVYLYDLTTNPPTETKLTASDAGRDDNFGWAVSLSADATTALVGALSDEDNCIDAGSAYRYDLTTNPPTETKLTASDIAADDRFGYSVALNDDATTALISARGDDDHGDNSGAAYHYDLTTNPPTETKLTATEADSRDFFGVDVSLDGAGTTALIGATGDDDGATDAGAVYVFGVTGPFITDIDVSPNPTNADAPVEIGATVADPTVGATIARADYEIRDTNDAVVASGSMQATDGAYDEASEAITTTVRGLPAGLYRVCVTGTDSRNTEGPEACVPLEVLDSTSGFVTGGGWLKSTPGAYLPNPAATGKATFNITAKTTPRSSTPRGHVTYQLKACNLAFKSQTLSALTATGTQAHLSGTGMLNRTKGYRFTVTVTDGDLASPQAPDHVHTRIWNPQNVLVYDNNANTELGRGNVSLKTR